MIGQMKTLIIYSQKNINDQIKEYLIKKEYLCEQIIQSKELDKIDNQNYDCMIIEDDFPKLDTHKFITHIKSKSNPIILVISHSLSVQYLDSLLNIGADDYITNPFQEKDLYIKIQSIYKNGILRPRTIYHFKDIILNINAKTCICHEQAVNLTKNEFKLLSLFISHPYQPFSTTYLFEKIWGSSLYDDNTSIPALINSLIIKLRQANEKEEYIKRFGKNQYKMAF